MLDAAAPFTLNLSPWTSTPRTISVPSPKLSIVISSVARGRASFSDSRLLPERSNTRKKKSREAGSASE